MDQADPRAYVMYGLNCSYFTGKLEAYFKNKGLPYRYVEMTTGHYRKCSIATGVVQLPCLQAPDGTWLTDTSAIIEHFESLGEGIPIRPTDPATAFCSLLLEDLFDEWFWRPALYYRWYPDEDSRLMSQWLARTMFRDVRLPLFMRRLFVLNRQRVVYLRKDGVTKRTAPAIEALYMESLRALDAVLSNRRYLFGERPCEADYGLFGPFFRHFFCDPTPAALMREHAPHVCHWVTRLWAARPADLENAPTSESVPDDLDYFFEMISKDYLPYLEANASAVASGDEAVRYSSQGIDWEIPAAPYRAQCLNRLKQEFAELDADAAGRVTELVSGEGASLLRKATTSVETATDYLGRMGRLGRAANLFD